MLTRRSFLLPCVLVGIVLFAGIGRSQTPSSQPLKAIKTVSGEQGLALPLPLPPLPTRTPGRTLRLIADADHNVLWIARTDGLYRWTPASAAMDRVFQGSDARITSYRDRLLWTVRTTEKPPTNELLVIDANTLSTIVRQPLNVSYGRGAHIETHETECCVFVTIANEFSSVAREDTTAFVFDKQRKTLTPTPYQVFEFFIVGQQRVAVKQDLRTGSPTAGMKFSPVSLCHVRESATEPFKDCVGTEMRFYRLSSRADDLPTTQAAFDGTHLWLLVHFFGKDNHESYELSKIEPTTLRSIASYGLPLRPGGRRTWDYRGIVVVGSRILVLAESGAGWFDETTKAIVPISIRQDCLTFLHPAVSATWVWSCNRFDEVVAIRSSDGTQNRYRFDIPAQSHPLFLAEPDDLRWIQTHDLTQLYAVDLPDGLVTKLPWSPIAAGGVQELASIHGQTYFGGGVDVMQWEPNSDLTFSIEDHGSAVESAALFLLSLFTTRKVVTDGVVGIRAEYVRPPMQGQREVPLGSLPNDHFWVRVKDGSGTEGPPIPVTDTVTIPIPLIARLWRKADIEFALYDAYGNRRRVTQRLLVVSSLVVGTSAWYVLIAVVMLIVVLAAPYIRFANDFIMNPYLRRWGTLLAVPLMLTLFPPLRRHLLKRYRRSLKQHVEPLAQLYVVPDPAIDVVRIVETLASNNRPVWLHGPSGIGKTAWIYYACHRLAGRDNPKATARDLPVLVLLRDYGDMEPEKVFLEALKARGQFDDVELAGEILRQGRVLFLVDGLNEVSATVQTRWLGFAKAYAGTHRFIFTSQTLPREREQFSVVQVPELSVEKMAEILREKAPAVAQQFETLTTSAGALLRNPANLLVVARLIEEGRNVPDTEYELYRAVVDPLRKRWADSDVPSNFEDLRTVAVTFATSGKGDVVTERKFSDQEQLIAARVLIQREGRLFFASDRIAAFLVAEAIAEDTTALRRMSPVANAQWKLILDMLCQTIDIDAADKVMSELLRGQPPAVDLAEFFVASLQRHRVVDNENSWLAQALLSLARARQAVILTNEVQPPTVVSAT